MISFLSIVQEKYPLAVLNYDLDIISSGSGKIGPSKHDLIDIACDLGQTLSKGDNRGPKFKEWRICCFCDEAIGTAMKM